MIQLLQKQLLDMELEQIYLLSLKVSNLPLEVGVNKIIGEKSDAEILAYLIQNEALYKEKSIERFMNNEQDIFKAYIGKTFISYDAEGNITNVDLNEYAGDGNAYIQKNMSFVPMRDVLLYPENYIIMIDPVTGQPDLYERQV